MGESHEELVRDHEISTRLLRRVLLSASLLGLLTIGGKLLGVLEKVFQARVLGTSADLDAYLVAISIPTSMYFYTREVIEPAVLPVYQKLRQTGGLHEARRFATAVGLIILIIGCAIVVPILFNAQRAIGVMAPGMEEPTRLLATRLTMATLPAGLIFALTALTAIVLNAHKRFVLPASGELAMKAVLAAAFALAVVRWGIAAAGPAFAVACLARLTVHVPGLARTGGFHAPIRLRHPAMSAALRLAVPLALGMLFSQVGSLADNYFGSKMGPGVISAVSFGRKLADLPLLVVSYSISVVVFPYFADLHIQYDHEALRRLLRKVLRLAMVIFGWATAVAVPLSFDAVRVVLEGGAFTAQSVEMTAPVLAAYAAGFVPLAIESILLQHFFARRDVVRPVAVGIAGVIVHVGLVAATWSWIGPPSIALSYVVAKSMKVIVLILLSKTWTFSLSGDSGFLLRLLAVMAGTTGVLTAVAAMQVSASWAPILRLAFFGFGGTLIFLLGIYVTGILGYLRSVLRSGS